MKNIFIKMLDMVLPIVLPLIISNAKVMKTTVEITKLRNVAGYEYTCACCGREIKNVFQVGFKTYGSECVINLFGAYGEKKVKQQNALAKAYAKYLPATIESYAKAHGYTEQQMFEHHMRNGGLN